MVRRGWRNCGVVAAVVALECVFGAMALTGGHLLLATHCTSQASLCVPRRFRQSSPLLAMSAEDGDRTAADDGGGNRLLDVLEFVVGTTFSSRLYVGSPELHVSLPLPQPEDYPKWIPGFVRLPKAVYGFVDRGVEEGWVQKAADDSVFEIKYGVLRGERKVLPDDKCESCELEKRKKASQRR